LTFTSTSTILAKRKKNSLFAHKHVHTNDFFANMPCWRAFALI